MKVSVSKSKNATIYYLSKSVRIDGKVTTKTIEKIGSYDEIKKSVVIWNLWNGQSNTLRRGLQKRELQKKTSSLSTLLLPELKKAAVGA